MLLLLMLLLIHFDLSAMNPEEDQNPHTQLHSITTAIQEHIIAHPNPKETISDDSLHALKDLIQNEENGFDIQTLCQLQDCREPGEVLTIQPYNNASKESLVFLATADESKKFDGLGSLYKAWRKFADRNVRIEEIVIPSDHWDIDPKSYTIKDIGGDNEININFSDALPIGMIITLEDGSTRKIPFVHSGLEASDKKFPRIKYVSNCDLETAHLLPSGFVPMQRALQDGVFGEPQEADFITHDEMLECSLCSLNYSYFSTGDTSPSSRHNCCTRWNLLQLLVDSRRLAELHALLDGQKLAIQSLPTTFPLESIDAFDSWLKGKKLQQIPAALLLDKLKEHETEFNFFLHKEYQEYKEIKDVFKIVKDIQRRESRRSRAVGAAALAGLVYSAGVLKVEVDSLPKRLEFGFALGFGEDPGRWLQPYALNGYLVLHYGVFRRQD